LTFEIRSDIPDFVSETNRDSKSDILDGIVNAALDWDWRVIR
jgi:hypothetical protein